MAWVQIAAATLSGNSFRQAVLFTPTVPLFTVAKLVAALSRVARVTAGLVESNGSLPPVLTQRHLQADCQEPGLAPET